MGFTPAAEPIKRFVSAIKERPELWSADNQIEGIGWKLDLAAAEALISLGDPEAGTEIASRYRDDDRVPVQRYARKVLDAAPAPGER